MAAKDLVCSTLKWNPSSIWPTAMTLWINKLLHESQVPVLQNRNTYICLAFEARMEYLKNTTLIFLNFTNYSHFPQKGRFRIE